MKNTPDSSTTTALFQRTATMPTDGTRRDLLNHLVQLPNWFVIDMGSRDRILPRVREENHGQTVHLFVSASSAHRILAESEACPDSAAVVSLSGYEMANFVSTLRQWGVRSITFEPGPHGVAWTIDEVVIALWSTLPGGRDDLEATRAQGDGSDPNRIAAIWESVCALPYWYFISDPVSASDPMIGICRDQPCALAFTDPRRARDVAISLDPSAKLEGNRLIALSPRPAVGWLKSLASRGVAGVVFNEGPRRIFLPSHRMTVPDDPLRSVA